MTEGTTAEVLAGSATWAAEAGDVVKYLGALPHDSVDLLFTSPPYEDSRSYGLPGKMPKGEEWVRWMCRVVIAAAPKVKGLIAVNCEGRTEDFSYSGVPLLLFADLKRAGFNMRKPPAYYRVGIPGSGGPDWLRNDLEPIICVTRPGRLPWSKPTACGKPPKYAAGGDMSNRKANGERVAPKTATPGGRRRSGTDKMEDQRAGAAARIERGYKLPEIANPGNAVLESYTAAEVAALLGGGQAIKCKAGGNHLGHPLAHENEAPFPLTLAEFFVQSFCPPGGVVCDPFAGSSTTGHAALIHGRRFLGCDLRASQIDLTRRRIESLPKQQPSEAKS